MSGDLDTGGAIRLVPAAADPDGPIYAWSDLSPFEQGYATEIIAAAGGTRFDRLAPETLAAILRDCEWFAELHGEWPHHDHGRGFWIGRQKGKHSPEFPPLTPYLGDDGLVRLRPAESPLADACRTGVGVRPRADQNQAPDAALQGDERGEGQ